VNKKNAHSKMLLQKWDLTMQCFPVKLSTEERSFPLFGTKICLTVK
jgi:hypothetical protein